MSHDTVVHGIVRPAVRALARTSVTPDHLTGLRFATAVAAAAAFAQGPGAWTVVGAGVFVVSALLDRADGELARQTGRFSRHGHRYDLVADCLAGVMAFIGLGLGATDGVLGSMAILLGLLAGAGIGGLFWQVNVAASGKLPVWTGRNGRVLADPDDGIFALPLLVLCFDPETVLVLGSVITPAATFWLASRRGRLGAAGERRRKLPSYLSSAPPSRHPR